MIRLGVDIGGSAIKAALVDLKTGELASENVRVKNSIDTHPEKAIQNLLNIMKKLSYSGPIGVGFPGRLRDNILQRAPNLHPDWAGKDLAEFFKHGTGSTTCLLNDADAAAIAEINFGNPVIKRTHRTLFLTLGTGIGSAFILDGKIWKDTELGHLLLRNGQIAEHHGSAAVKRLEKLSWKQWAQRLNTVLKFYDFSFSPDLIILGGAISKNLEKFQKYLNFPETKIIMAQLGNDAGIIGAAMETVNSE